MKPKARNQKSETSRPRQIPDRSSPVQGVRPFSWRGLRVLTTRKSAFTFVEIMAVLLIIIVLVGGVVGIAGYAQRRAAINQARADIAELSRAIELFKVETGAYPASGTQNLTLVCSPRAIGVISVPATFPTNVAVYQLGTMSTNWACMPNPCITTNFVGYVLDPWGFAYNYTRPGTRNRASFDLWSTGPSGRFVGSGSARTNEWITNWR